MEADALAERILLDLKNTFKKDPLIDEFDIIPVSESKRNTSPVVHIDHKVALEDWCIKHVYVYAYDRFFEWRRKPYKVDSDLLLMWSTAILLINPEPETVWNARKELVCQKTVLPENELKFSELVLSRKPKSSPVYAHRKWVLLELMKSNPSPCTVQQIVHHEILLCSRFASLYPNNYHAWSHRSWLLTQIDGLQPKTVSNELKRTISWASTHISDYCGFHYRQFLLSCLHNHSSHHDTLNSTKVSETDTNSVQSNHSYSNEASTLNAHCSVHLLFNEAIRKELDFLGGLQTTYQGHEALWYHRRYILYEIGRLGAGFRGGRVGMPQGKVVQVSFDSSYGNVNGPSGGLGLKADVSGEGHSLAKENGEVFLTESSLKCHKCYLECHAVEHNFSNTNGSGLQLLSHIDEIHGLGAENGDASMEVSVHCNSDKPERANSDAEHSSGERGIQSSIGDIHSLVLEDVNSMEGLAKCKRYKLEGVSTGQEQGSMVEEAIPSDNLDMHPFENSMDNENGEIASMVPSDCKRCKLDCANSRQEMRSEQRIHYTHPSPGNVAIPLRNDIETTSIEASAQCKKHNLAFAIAGRQHIQELEPVPKISPESSSGPGATFSLERSSGPGQAFSLESSFGPGQAFSQGSNPGPGMSFSPDISSGLGQAFSQGSNPGLGKSFSLENSPGLQAVFSQGSSLGSGEAFSTESTMEASQQSNNHKSSCSNSKQTTNVDNIANSKRHIGNSEVWTPLEEESFLRKLLAKSCEGEWERILIQRHVVWMSRTLQWSLLLS